MSDSNRSIAEVPGLIEERKRYEGWLAALESRRDSTPLHVFDRVRADYRARLERVAEQIASHRQAIEEERASVQSRVSLLEAEERLQRDERAELELRAHVGELVGEDAETSFRTVDEAIEKLVSEKETLQARVAELQHLLDEGVVAEEAAPAATVEEASAEVIEAEAEGAAPAAQSADESGEQPTAIATPPSTESLASEKSQGGGSFDELAFLSSVVGKDPKPSAAGSAGADALAGGTAQAPIVERRGSEPLLRARDIERDEGPESLLAGVDKTKRATGDHPLAANVPANTPIVLRPTAGTIEQSKTLKCNECGAMNYPTEWYCERCGAELAAL